MFGARLLYIHSQTHRALTGPVPRAHVDVCTSELHGGSHGSRKKRWSFVGQKSC